MDWTIPEMLRCEPIVVKMLAKAKHPVTIFQIGEFIAKETGIKEQKASRVAREVVKELERKGKLERAVADVWNLRVPLRPLR